MTPAAAAVMIAAIFFAGTVTGLLIAAVLK